jgi:uncharacterized membrane protein YfcA
LIDHAWQWALAGLGALLVGLAKTGLPGLSLLFVSIFASIIPARRSTGVVVPLLILGDVIAVLSYRRHAQWSHLWRLFPWAAAGVLAGYFALKRMNDRQASTAIGLIVVALAILHLVRRANPGPLREDRTVVFAPLIGVLAGFATIVSNAAGPLMVIYLLAMRLPKMEYMGTGAVFFLLLNLFKVPFMCSLGLITTESLRLDLELAPFVLAGTWAGRRLLGRIDQRLFENVSLALTLGAGARMLF